MCLCLNSELADIQNLLSFAFLIHRGYLPVVSCSEHNLLINFQFIDPKGNLSLLCTGYCYNKMLHKGALKIKAFYVHFNQYHFYLIYSPVLNFLAASKTKKWYCQFYRCKKITTMVTTGWQTVRERPRNFETRRLKQPCYTQGKNYGMVIFFVFVFVSFIISFWVSEIKWYFGIVSV